MVQVSKKNKRLQEFTVKSSQDTIARAKKLIQQPIDPIYKELAGKLDPKFKDSIYLPHVLARTLNLEQAKIANALPDTDHEETMGRLEVSEKFAQKVGVAKKTIDKHMQELYEKGYIFPTRKGPMPPRAVVQWFDSQNNVKYDAASGKEFFDLLRAFNEEEMSKGRTERLARGPGFRIVPRWKSIQDVPGVLPIEDVREILKAAQPIAVVHCACKKRYYDRVCDVPDEVCMVTGRTAEYNIDRGAGKKLTLKQALDMVEDLSKVPTVHTVGNSITKPEAVSLFCNCHWDCCGVLRTGGMPDSGVKFEQIYAKSRFQATVDPKKCIGCMTCVESRCQFSAAQMKFYPELNAERAFIDVEACMGCGNCVETCPVGARSMKEVRPQSEVLDKEQQKGYEGVI